MAELNLSFFFHLGELGWLKTQVEATGIFSHHSILEDDVSFTAWGIFHGEVRHIVDSLT